MIKAIFHYFGLEVVPTHEMMALERDLSYFKTLTRKLNLSNTEDKIYINDLETIIELND